MATIRVGVGGWTFPPWRGPFYPQGVAQKDELAFASRQLDTIEINGTYYGSQKPESFAKWRDETPDGFVFSVKAPRFATNRRVLAEAGASVERFFASGVMELRDRLGPVNWQFLPNKAFDPADFAAFLKLLPTSVEGRAIRHVVEVRHATFRNAEFVALLRSHDVAVAIAGDAAHPQIPDRTASFVYARIMGTTEAEPLGYGPEALGVWAERARAWAAGRSPADLPLVGSPTPDGPARDVFIYVISGFKPANPTAAKALIARLAGNLAVADTQASHTPNARDMKDKAVNCTKVALKPHG